MTAEAKKYELLSDDTLYIKDRTLCRIRALRDFGNVSAGDEGGFIEAECNLSHEGTAWVRDDAKVYENASVVGDALVHGYAQVYGDANVYGHAMVYGNAKVYGRASVNDHSRVHGYAQVYGSASVGGSACISYTSRIYGDATIYDAPRIKGAHVYDAAIVAGTAQLGSDVAICGTACILGNVVIRSLENARAFIADNDSLVAFYNVGSENGVLTVYYAASGDIVCTRGCFTGVVDDFLKAVAYEHGANHIAKEYSLMIHAALLRLSRIPRESRKTENVESEAVEAADDDAGEVQ